MKANKNKQGQIIVGIPKEWYRKDTPNQITEGYDKHFKEEDYIYDGWVDYTPAVIGENQRRGSHKEILDESGELIGVTDHVIDKTTEEIQQELISNSESEKQMLIQAKTETKIIEDAQLIEDDAEALENQALYLFWDENGIEVFEGYKYQRIVGLELHLYKVKIGKGHITQPLWTPENNPSLFTRVGFADEAVPWDATSASTGEYTLGYIVTHNGNTWISIFDGVNAWEPGEFGWEIYNN